MWPVVYYPKSALTKKSTGIFRFFGVHFYGLDNEETKQKHFPIDNVPNKPGNKYFVAWRPRAGGSLGTRLVKARILPSYCENSAKWRAFFSPRFCRLGKAVKILKNPGNG